MASLEYEHYAAVLHDCARHQSHPDSKEAIQIERQRVAQELEPIEHHEALLATVSLSNKHQNTSLQRRQSSNQSSNAYDVPPQCCGSYMGYDITESDIIRSNGSSIREKHWHSSIVTFWMTHVSLTIDEGAYRDHLALERTFLGYLRTSLILVMTGAIIAQLFRIQHSQNPNTDIGFYVIGEPLSVAFISMAIFVLLVGAIRFWRLQNALMRGKALAGGWEVFLIITMSSLLLMVTFGLVLAVNIDKAK